MKAERRAWMTRCSTSSLWPFGEVAYPFVKKKVEGIFRYRRAKIREILGC
jgi:hypothetical protein